MMLACIVMAGCGLFGGRMWLLVYAGGDLEDV